MTDTMTPEEVVIQILPKIEFVLRLKVDIGSKLSPSLLRCLFICGIG